MPDEPRLPRFPKGLVWGLLVVSIGIIFLFDQMGVVSADHLFRFFWPGIFLFFGLEGVLFGTGPGKFWGTLLTATGVLLLLDTFGVIHVTVAVIWPLLIIFWGVSILLQALGRAPGCGPNWQSNWFKNTLKTGGTESELDYTLVFSGVKRRVTSPNFKGGKIVAVFGGFNLDLRKAEIDGQEAEIHADAVFGGGEIRVPESWRVSVRTASIFGAFVDETRPPVDEGPATKRLLITGSAVFGGVNVKN
jgi:predicted membrane protein